METRTKYGLLVEIDPEQYYPDDPGQGTPVLVTWKKYGVTASIYCAVDSGEIEGHDLTMSQLEWLEEISEECDEILGTTT